MLRSVSVAFIVLLVILSIANTLPGEAGEKVDKADGIQGRPAVPSEAGRSTHLLDRGKSDRGGAVLHGGGPATPIPIAFPGAGPMDTASGFAAGVGAFGTASGAGAFAGNLFAPGPGYPPGFLTGGATSGFDVTGVYAWHSPFLKTGPVSATPAGSTRRILAAAAAAVPGTPLSAVTVAPAGFEVVTVSGSPSAAPGGPTAIVGGPGNLALPVAIAPGGFSAVFCGLAIGGAGFIDTGWVANGVGAVIPPGALAMPPSLRNGFPAAFFGGGPFPISAIAFTATPQTQVAGCFAAGSTTPVELQSFHIN